MPAGSAPVERAVVDLVRADQPAGTARGTRLGEITFGAAKERSLVAALALNPGHVVGADALIDALWGDAPPATARKTLQTYVKNIRRACGSDAIATVESGYALRITPEDVDVVRFRALVRYAEGLRLKDEGLPESAIAERLELSPEAVGPLLRLAEQKLARLIETP